MRLRSRTGSARSTNAIRAVAAEKADVGVPVSQAATFFGATADVHSIRNAKHHRRHASLSFGPYMGSLDIDRRRQIAGLIFQVGGCLNESGSQLGIGGCLSHLEQRRRCLACVETVFSHDRILDCLTKD